jgi:type I restriction-modification system DNA methylase subunit
MEYEIADHLDKKQKQDQGSFYTPQEISEKMAKMLNYKDGKILDPCVGKGNLFVACIKIYNLKEPYDMLYGVDIDEEAIRFCIQKFPGGHFQVGNCLEDDLSNDDFWKKDPFSKYVPTFMSKFGQIRR